MESPPALDLDAPAVARVVVPVEQHRGQRRQQRIGDRARAGLVVVCGSRAARSPAPRRRCAARPWDARRRAAAPAPASPRRAVRAGCAVAPCRRPAPRRWAACRGPAGTPLLQTRSARPGRDVVAAIVQVVAALADGADGGVARGRARQRDGLLGLEGRARSLRLELIEPPEAQASVRNLTKCMQR